MNLFGSKEYKSMLKVNPKWVENGYVHPVDAQINESTVLWYETGSCFGMFTDTSAENQVRISEKAGVETNRNYSAGGKNSIQASCRSGTG